VNSRRLVKREKETCKSSYVAVLYFCYPSAHGCLVFPFQKFYPKKLTFYMFSKQELWDEYKDYTAEMEILLKRVKSINFCSPVGCVGKVQEHFGKRKFKQHSMMNDLRKEFVVCSNKLCTINIIKNHKKFYL
jgi:hypothetical protein